MCIRDSMVVAPEHPLVDVLTEGTWPEGTKPAWTGGHAFPNEAVEAYRNRTSQMSDRERQENKEKTGVFTGSYAVNPVNDESIPVFIADYVLMGYGTGAIMAVPGQDERDWEFAEAFDLDIIRTVEPPADFDLDAGKAYIGDGPAINSGFLDGMGVVEAKSAMIEHLQETKAGAVSYTHLTLPTKA